MRSRRLRSAHGGHLRAWVDPHGIGTTLVSPVVVSVSRDSTGRTQTPLRMARSCSTSGAMSDAGHVSSVSRVHVGIEWSGLAPDAVEACPWHRGRRVLVSRQWTGKTLSDHRADRAAIVRATLAEAGIEALDTDRCSATATDDGQPRFVWSPVSAEDDDVPTYRRVMADAIAEAVRWRTEYEHAKQRARAPDDTRAATDTDPASSAA